MNQGKCTNLPTECEKAATGELQMMPTDDTRCAECDSLLTVSNNSKAAHSNIIKYIIIGALITVLILLLILAYNFFIKDKSTDTNCVGADCPTANITATDNGLVNTPTNQNANPTSQDTSSQESSNENTTTENIALEIQGSNTIGSELMPKLISAYYSKVGSDFVNTNSEGLDDNTFIFRDKRQQAFAVDLGSHGSSTGFKALSEGQADIAMSSRKIKPEEITLLQDKGLGNMTDASQEFIIGIDGIAIIVHQSNPINKLSVSDLRNIFSGQITNWSELGGTNQDITLYVRDENSGTKDTFDSLVMKKTAVANAQTFEDSNELSEAVSKDSGAIGYIGLPYINSAKALSISDGTKTALKPTPFTLSTEDYPLTRRLYLYIPINASSAARELANFAISSEGQQIVEQTGFIGQKATSQKLQDVDPEVVNINTGYKSLFENAERINTNFRFAFNSTELDNKAKHDLGRVTDLLNEKNKSDANYRLVLVGFTDNTGSACVNNTISLNRARIVANELAAYGVKADIVEGMGSEAPVSDNHTELGREKNRRVELWLAPLDKLPRFPIKPTCAS